MADYIQVNTQALGNDIENLQLQLGEARKDVQQMYEAVMALERTWTGKAKRLYLAKFISDKNSMDDMCDKLQKIIDQYSYAKTEYENCERKVAEIVNSISV